MAAKESLQNIFHEVAGVKLADLKKQRSAILDHFQPVLDSINEPNLTPHQVLSLLGNAIRTGPHFHDFSSLIQDLNSFLDYSLNNPTIHSALTDVWIQKVKEEIQFSVEKSKYSHLYGSLFWEWIQNNPKGIPDLDTSPENEKEKTVEELSLKIFTKPEGFDKVKFLEFLHTKLFNFTGNPKEKEIFDGIIQETNKFSRMENFVVTTHITKATIRGLHSRNLFWKERQEALLDLIRNEDAIVEITGILSDRLKNFTHWNWPGPLKVQMVRGITGHFRAYMDEDTLTALFLQLVGVIWGVHFKSVLKKLYESEFWVRTGHDLGNKQKNSIERKRRDFHRGCFLTTLPENVMLQSQNPYENEEDEGQGQDDGTVNPLQLRSRIVHVINTEVKLNEVVNPGGGLTVVQTDMEWFGPSLVHEAILTILEFLGVSQDWLQFFHRFLRAPIDLEGDGTVRTRERGVPICHSLSQFFGELNLFLLDVTVNKISGENLFRLYDDMWFWGRNSEKMSKAWDGIQELSAMVGLKVNLEKSGSCVTGSGSNVPENLPQTPVRWGFLKLDSTHGFEIDFEQFEPFIQKMVQLLDKSPSVLGWITVYNKFMKFVIRHSGKPCRILGTEHLEQIIEALKLIHQKAFPSTDGSPTQSLKNKFPELMKDVLDSWIYWPLNSGGLGLMNPFLQILPLLQAYKDKKDGAEIGFQSLVAQDVRNYEKRTKEVVKKNEKLPESQRKVPKSWEGYCGERETRNNEWGQWYSTLMTSLDPKGPPSLGCRTDKNLETWMNSIYGPEIREHFGSDSILDPKFIPVTLVSLLEKTKITT